MDNVLSKIHQTIFNIFKNSDIRKKIFLGGTWVTIGQGILFISSIAVNALLARLLLPAELGAYFLTLSLVTFASIVSQLGLNQTAIKLVAESLTKNQEGRARQSIKWVLVIAGTSTLLIIIIVLFGGGEWSARRLFHSDLMVSVVWLMPFWIVISVFQGLISEIFRGFNDIRYATIFGGASPKVLLLIFLAGAWLFGWRGTLNLVIVATLFAGGLNTVLAFFLLYKKMFLLTRGSIENITPRLILLNSWPLWITNLLLFFLVQADLWILGIFSSQNEVAVYGAAARLVAIVTAPLMLANAVTPPIIVELYTQDKIQKLEKMLRKIITLIGIPAILILILILFWSEDILSLFYGDYYRMGGMVLAILSIGQFFNVWAGSCGQVLMLTGHQKEMLLATMVGGGVTIIGALITVQYIGITGVAISAAIGMIIQNTLMLFAVKKKINIWTSMSIRSLFN